MSILEFAAIFAGLVIGRLLAELIIQAIRRRQR